MRDFAFYLDGMEAYTVWRTQLNLGKQIHFLWIKDNYKSDFVLIEHEYTHFVTNERAIEIFPDTVMALWAQDNEAGTIGFKHVTYQGRITRVLSESAFLEDMQSGKVLQ